MSMRDMTEMLTGSFAFSVITYVPTQTQLEEKGDTEERRVLGFQKFPLSMRDVTQTQLEEKGHERRDALSSNGL